MAADLIALEFKVLVRIDPTDDELLDLYDESDGSFSVANIVRSEIQSNLESVSYVRWVTVMSKRKKGGES